MSLIFTILETLCLSEFFLLFSTMLTLPWEDFYFYFYKTVLMEKETPYFPFFFQIRENLRNKLSSHGFGESSEKGADIEAHVT